MSEPLATPVAPVAAPEIAKRAGPRRVVARRTVTDRPPAERPTVADPFRAWLVSLAGIVVGAEDWLGEYDKRSARLERSELIVSELAGLAAHIPDHLRPAS